MKKVVRTCLRLQGQRDHPFVENVEKPMPQSPFLLSVVVVAFTGICICRRGSPERIDGYQISTGRVFFKRNQTFDDHESTLARDDFDSGLYGCTS